MKRIIPVILFALVISAGASYFIYQMLNSRLASAQNQQMSRVWVASHELGTGVLIKETDIKQVSWTGPTPARVLQKKEEIVGRGVMSTLYPDEPILNDRLAPIGAGAGMAATIPMGMRAVALRVNDVVGVAGFVTPGMRVDVLIMGMPPNASVQTGTVSKTLLQNIEVLSAGQQIQKDAEGKPIPVPVVNLLLTPEQAEIVSLASNQTRIQLILRNPMDKEESKTKGVAFASLFAENPLKGGPPVTPPRAVRQAPRPQPVAAAKTPPPAPQKITVEIIHGGRKAEVKFDEEKPEAKEEKP